MPLSALPSRTWRQAANSSLKTCSLLRYLYAKINVRSTSVLSGTSHLRGGDTLSWWRRWNYVDWLRPENGNLPHPPTVPTIRGAARRRVFNVSHVFVFLTYSLLFFFQKKSVMVNHPREVRNPLYWWPFHESHMVPVRAPRPSQPLDWATAAKDPCVPEFIVVLHGGEQQALKTGKQWHLGFCGGTSQTRYAVNLVHYISRNFYCCFGDLC